MQYGGDYHMQLGTVLGHIYLSLDSGYGRTQWQVADSGLCMIVFLSQWVYIKIFSWCPPIQAVLEILSYAKI